MISRLIKLHRLLSWVLVAVGAVTLVSGYGVTKRFSDPSLMQEIHLLFIWFFIALLAFHVFMTVFMMPFSWRYSLRKICSGQAGSRLWLRVLQRLSGGAVLLTASLVIISGLDWYESGIGGALPFHQHLRYDIYLAVSAILHVAVSVKLALVRKTFLRKTVKALAVNIPIVTILIAAFLFVGYADLFAAGSARSGTPGDDTVPTAIAEVEIGSEKFKFDSTEVETVRPDLFNPGYFSVFDLLVHLDTLGEIELQYHFDESMNTHVIDSINREPDWWYYAYYDGGWQERNVFRMDHYPWKEGTTLRFYKAERPQLQDIYSIFKEEVTRRSDNSGRLVVPKVVINGRTFTRDFANVEVTSHNMRSDMFVEGVTTALDVILSLGDLGKIEYELQWYESIATARIVRSYWVEAIEGDKTRGRCGFVYEAGSWELRRSANHIHVPADIRILNSPEYVEFFWACV